MTIKVYRDRIELGSYTLTATPTGASFNGSIAASKLSTKFVVGQGQSFGYNISRAFGGQGGGYRFPFQADSITQDLTSLVPTGSSAMYRGTSHSSQTHGYRTSSWMPENTRENAGVAPLVPAYLGSFNPIVRFSFSTGFSLQDVGTFATSFKSNQRFITTTGGLSSKQDGYILPYDGQIYKFSFSSGVNKSYCEVNASIYNSSPYSTYAGSTVSTEYNGYVVDGIEWRQDPRLPALFAPPSGQYTSSCRKFPFATENIIATMPTSVVPLTSPAGTGFSGHMTGISGVDNGYFCFGAQSTPFVLNYGLGGSQPPPSIGVSSHPLHLRVIKYQYSSDTTSIIPITTLGGCAAAGGTASPTKGYLLNGKGTMFHNASPLSNSPTDPPYQKISVSVAYSNIYPPSPFLPDLFVELSNSRGRVSFDFANDTTITAIPSSPATLAYGLSFQY